MQLSDTSENRVLGAINRIQHSSYHIVIIAGIGIGTNFPGCYILQIQFL